MQQAADDSGKGSKLRWSVRQCEDMAALQVRLLTAALKVKLLSLSIILLDALPTPRAT